jgi:hypothetical protein
LAQLWRKEAWNRHLPHYKMAAITLGRYGRLQFRRRPLRFLTHRRTAGIAWKYTVR